MVFPSRRHAAAAFLSIALWFVPGSVPLVARRQDSEEDLLARIQREQNPVKKAKYEIRLGRVKLTQAIAAYGAGDVDRCNGLVAAYLAQIKTAWTRLQSAGRNAVKKPEGFRELDIALREDARLIEDLQHRIPYNERDQVAKVAQEVEQIRREVLGAIFPSEESPRSKKRSVGGRLSCCMAASEVRLDSTVHGAGSRAMSGLTGSPWLPLEATLRAASPQTKRPDVLSDDEEDKLREEQDPAKRIELYVSFAQDRLNRFVNFRSRPADPKYDTGEYLNRLLGEYVAVDDELKDWMEYQFGRTSDMRSGLRALLERGPRQLEQLRQVQQSPDAFASDYASSLRDAIDDLSDTLDGAAKALAEQEKKFGELKREEKTEARAAKERQKEKKKRSKEEKKLQKRERKRANPAEADDE